MKKIFLFIAFTIAVMGCKKDSGSNWDNPVIPVSLVDIEAVNIDNAGEFPTISASPIKKEAYMIGIKWIMDYVINDGDKFITGAIRKENTFSSAGSKYSKAIICNNQFNSSIPAGTYISKFFKEMESDYLPADVDEGFVLLVAPDAGEHSFRVEYYEGNTLKFFHDTPTINFY